MSRLIDVRDAMICCGGSSTAMARNIAGSAQKIAAELIAQATKTREAASPVVGQSFLLVIGKVLQAVKDQRWEEFIAAYKGLVGTAGILPQQIEWLPPELQQTTTDANLVNGIDLGQLTIVINQAAEEQLARHRQRVRNCLLERALRQDKPRQRFAGPFRTRRASRSLASRVTNFFNRFLRRPGN